MSTPHVSGLAALIWSLDPTLGADQVREYLQASALDLIPPGGDSCSIWYPGYVGLPDWDPCFGHGRINAKQALQSVSSIMLQETTGQPLMAPVTFLADDDEGPLPPDKTIQVATTGSEAITWTVSISPSVSWLAVSPPTSGVVTSSTPDQFTVTASKPASYGVHSATIVVSGTNSDGEEVSTATADVRLEFVSTPQRYYLPFIYSQYNQ
jgi:subtilisin family serine protease